MAKTGQNLVPSSMLKGTPDWKEYTTAGSDLYQLCRCIGGIGESVPEGSNNECTFLGKTSWGKKYFLSGVARMGGDGGEIVLFEISSLSCGSANAIFRKVKFLALMPSNCTTSSSLLRVIWTPKKGRKYLMKEEENEDNIWRGKICNSWLWCLPTTTALPPSPPTPPPCYE